MPTFPAHLLGDDDQKCDQILGIQHEVLFAHNVAQCPREEVPPASMWDKGGVISRKAPGGGSDPAQHPQNMGAGPAQGVPEGGAGTWGSVCPQLCSWQGLSCHHQSPEGLLIPTPRTPVLPWCHCCWEGTTGS